MHAVKKKPEIVIPKKIPKKLPLVKKGYAVTTAPPPPTGVSGTAAAVGVTVGRH